MFHLVCTLRSLINVQSLITVHGVTLFYKKFKVSSGIGLFPFLTLRSLINVQSVIKTYRVTNFPKRISVQVGKVLQ